MSVVRIGGENTHTKVFKGLDIEMEFKSASLNNFCISFVTFVPFV